MSPAHGLGHNDTSQVWRLSHYLSVLLELGGTFSGAGEWRQERDRNPRNDKLASRRVSQRQGASLGGMSEGIKLKALMSPEDMQTLGEALPQTGRRIFLAWLTWGRPFDKLRVTRWD